MARLNQVFSSLPLTTHQVRRDLMGNAAKTMERIVSHAYTGEDGINDELKVPKQWTISSLTAEEMMEEIEQQIDYVDSDRRSVRLQPVFVKAFLRRRQDRSIPKLSAIVMNPLVLADGNIIGKSESFEERRGIEFLVDDELAKRIPNREDCGPPAVADALSFLVDEWLCDVLADFTGKCVAVAMVLTILERVLLEERPVFSVTAGRRGTGKSTLVKMIIAVVSKKPAAAAAWSPNEEERRKALMSYLMSGVPYILWDNIPRGYALSCPNIERACTSETYTDRILGETRTVEAPANAIHIFTGNNITTKGDLASRSLMINLSADSSDPENRQFTHPDPISWTMANQNKILVALYTILLGNPMLDASRDAALDTRFKTWWRLVGSAVEHAANVLASRQETQSAASRDAAKQFKFKELFLQRDENDEDDTSLYDVLVKLAEMWPNNNRFEANAIARVVNGPDTPLRHAIRDNLLPKLRPSDHASSTLVGHALKKYVGNVVSFTGGRIVLKEEPQTGTRRTPKEYYVEVTTVPATLGQLVLQSGRQLATLGQAIMRQAIMRSRSPI
jgi:hypothetical protein